MEPKRYNQIHGHYSMSMKQHPKGEWIQWEDAEQSQKDITKELELLRKIAVAAKRLWDMEKLPMEAIDLANLLTDYIDFQEGHSTPGKA